MIFSSRLSIGLAAALASSHFGDAYRVSTSKYCVWVHDYPLCPGDSPMEVGDPNVGAAYFIIHSGFAPGTRAIKELRPKWMDTFNTVGVEDRDSLLVFGPNYCLGKETTWGYQHLGCAQECYWTPDNPRPKLPNPYYNRDMGAGDSTPNFSDPISGERSGRFNQAPPNNCVNPNTVSALLDSTGSGSGSGSETAQPTDGSIPNSNNNDLQHNLASTQQDQTVGDNFNAATNPIQLAPVANSIFQDQGAMGDSTTGVFYDPSMGNIKQKRDGRPYTRHLHLARVLVKS